MLELVRVLFGQLFRACQVHRLADDPVVLPDSITEVGHQTVLDDVDGNARDVDAE